MHVAVWRDHDRRNPRPTLERIAFRVEAADVRRLVIIETIRLVVGDNDRAILPVRAGCDRVDLIGEQGFGDLSVGISWMIVVAREGRLHRGVGIERLEAVEIVVATTHIEHTAVVRKLLIRDRAEEVIQSMQIGGHLGVVADIAKILRAIVVNDVAGVCGWASPIGRLVVVAFLVPAPIHWRELVACNLLDVVLHVEQVQRRVFVTGDDLLDTFAHERERQRRIGLVQRRRVRVLITRVVGRLNRGLVKIGTRERTWVANHGLAAAYCNGSARGVIAAFAWVQGPLRLAGLTGNHRNRVRCRGADHRLMEVVEQREAVGILPQERDRVAVDMRHS